MPLYNDPLGPTACVPGDSLVLFDGTETPGSSVKSIALARQMGPQPGPAGIVFTISFGSSPTDALEIQASNEDVDAEYITLQTSTNTQNDYYADAGNFAFYRAVLSTYSAGGMPRVIAQR